MSVYKADAYLRLSYAADRTEESDSIQNQKKLIQDFVAAHPDIELVSQRVDDGYSGVLFDRPAFLEMMEDIKAGKVNCVIVKDLSRLGREFVDTGRYLRQIFPAYGVRFISINDDFDSGKLHGDTGGLGVAFKYLVNELYSRDLSMKYKSSKYMKFKRGEYPSKICPYGYQRSADGRMELDPETAPNVRLIFEMAAQGMNTTGVIKALFDRNIPTPGEYKKAKGQANHDVSRCGGIWQRSTLSRLLQDERYTGTYIIGKREVVDVGGSRVRLKDESQWVKIPGHHPAIISKELFEQTQSAIRRVKCPKKHIHLYPLRGKVYCGNCLHRMPRIGNVTFRFTCTHTQADESAPCHRLKVEEAALESAIFAVLSKQAQVIWGTAESIGSVSVLAAEHAGNSQQIRELQEQKRTLFEHLVLHKLTEQYYQMKKAAIDNDLAQLKEVQTARSTQLSQRQADVKTKNANRELAQKVMDTGQLSSELVDALIERVYVYPGQEIEIVWKIAGFELSQREL